MTFEATTDEATPMAVEAESGVDSFSVEKGSEAIATGDGIHQTNENNNNNDDDHDDDDDDDAEGGEEHSFLADRPIVCILEDKQPLDPTSSSSSSPPSAPKRRRCRMFRVIRSKGKALASGGFGVTVIADESGKDAESDDEHEDDEIENEENEIENENDEIEIEDNKTEPATKATKSEEAANDASSEPLASTSTSTSTSTTTTTTKSNPNPNNAGPKRSSSEYLFIEEALFLHEKGLLRALKRTTPPKGAKEPPADAATGAGKGDETINDNDNDNDNYNGDIIDTIHNAQPLDTSQLYRLLPSMGMSLAVYRVYSHLRSQDFRVLRHDPHRYEILCRQQRDREARAQRAIEQQREREKAREQQRRRRQQQTNANANANLEPAFESQPDDPSSDAAPGVGHGNDNGGGGSTPTRAPAQRPNFRKQSLRLRREIRASVQNAPPPAAGSASLCWDAYHPNSNFGKTHPGFPDFCVAVTYYNVPGVRFSDLRALLEEDSFCSRGIPLKVATVSDSGTVVMFGITDYGIPPLEKKTSVTK